MIYMCMRKYQIVYLGWFKSPISVESVRFARMSLKHTTVKQYFPAIIQLYQVLTASDYTCRSMKCNIHYPEKLMPYLNKFEPQLQNILIIAYQYSVFSPIFL